MTIWPSTTRSPLYATTHSSFMPLLLASCMACAMVVVRVYVSSSPAYVHMIWNLFLAWIPYAISLAMVEYGRRESSTGWLFLPGTVWLLFLPNAPYLVTDFVHLLETPSVGLWYDIALLANFAWIGGCLTAVSLRLVQRLIAARAGRLIANAFVVIVAGLGGFGVYLGRYLRWNSWDVLVDPFGLLSDISARLTDPFGHPRTVGMTCVFAALILICYITYPATTDEW